MRFLFGCFLVIWGLNATLAFNISAYPSSYVVFEPDVYTLYWRVDESAEEVYFGLKVKTLGWVGFGIGEPTSGSMPGADIVVGSVVGGTFSLSDRHATRKATPSEDCSQDWVGISGSEVGAFTMLEFKRKMNTGDAQDRPIHSGQLRLVAAYGQDSQETIMYHESRRRGFPLALFGGSNENPLAQLIANPDVQFLDILNENYSIPTDTTTYYEPSFPVPSNIFIVGIQEIIDPATSIHVHHFLLYGCDAVPPAECSQKLLWTWAPGTSPLVLPNVASFPVGPASNIVALSIQFHFDNPTRIAGLKDNSGLRLYYVTSPRQFAAAVLELGDPLVTNPAVIPAGSGLSYFEYDCPSECFNGLQMPLNVFAIMLHMHAVGSQIWGRQWRGNTLVRETNRIDFWDFNFQQTTNVNFTIQAGDRISTHCVYAQGNNPTPFGLASQDEMCVQFMFYYPALATASDQCGYVSDNDDDDDDDERSNTNYTMCPGPNFLDIRNPTKRDPPGGTVKSFGVCKVESGSSILFFDALLLFCAGWFAVQYV